MLRKYSQLLSPVKSPPVIKDVHTLEICSFLAGLLDQALCRDGAAPRFYDYAVSRQMRTR